MEIPELNKKGSISLTEIMTSILVFALVMTALAIPLTDMAAEDKNDVNISGVNDSLAKYENTFDETTGLAVDVRNDTRGAQASQQAETGFNLATAKKALNTVFDSFTIVTDMLNAAQDKLYIPQVFITAFKGILIFAVIFITLGAIMRANLSTD